MADLAGMAGAGRRRAPGGGASAPPRHRRAHPAPNRHARPCLTVTHRLYLADSGPFPRQNPALRSGEVLVLGIMKYADLDVLKYVFHAKEYHVHEERRDGASPARRTRERRWRACSAAVAGMLLLAVGSSGCATVLAQHKIATHGSTLQGSGNSEGGTGSLGKLGSALDGKGSKAHAAGTLAGVGNGVMFGGDVPLAAVQGPLGRSLAIVRVYDRLGDSFQSRLVNNFMAHGTTILMSLDTFPGGTPYSAIAAGQQDATITAFLESMNSSAIRNRLPAIYFTFEHEANVAANHLGLGTAAQFIAAWDHVHQIAVSHHLLWNQGGRIHFVLILTHFYYNNGKAIQWWPGTNEVDIVSADGYNTGGCRTARKNHSGFTTGVTPPESPTSLFTGVVQFAAAHGGLPVFIAEWGSVAYSNASVRVQWIQQMQSFVAANPAIHAALYWDSQVPPCNYIINNSPSSLSALTTLAQSSLMQGRPA